MVRSEIQHSVFMQDYNPKFPTAVQVLKVETVSFDNEHKALDCSHSLLPKTPSLFVTGLSCLNSN